MADSPVAVRGAERACGQKLAMRLNALTAAELTSLTDHIVARLLDHRGSAPHLPMDEA